MQLHRPSLDALSTGAGAMVLLLLIFGRIVASPLSVLSAKPGTFLVVAIVGSLLFLGGIILGTIRHKEGLPLILGVLGVLCLVLSTVLPSMIFTTLSIVTIVIATGLNIAFKTQQMSVPEAPSMQELLGDIV